MKKIFCILTSCLFFLPGIAQVRYVEYFIDTDPGYGKGTAVGQPGSAVTSGNEWVQELTFTVPLAGLADGWHMVYIRALGENNRWSQGMCRPFVKTGLPHELSSQVTAAEYFIDTDPGIGKGIPVTVRKDEADLNLAIPLADISLGNHTVKIRGKNRLGEWTELGTHAFTVVVSSIHELPDNRIMVYPNPVTDMLFVKNDDLSITSVTLTDINGNTVMNPAENRDHPVISLSLASLPAGIYFIQLKTEKEYKTLKIKKN